MGFSLKKIAGGLLGGGIMGGSFSALKGALGGQPNEQTQTTNNAPWAAQQPYLTYGFGEQRRLYDNGPSTVIPFSNETEQALQMQQQRAMNNPAVGTLDATLRGDYLYGGPGFNAAYGAAADQIMPSVQSMFSRAGRTGSGLAQGEMTKQLGNAFAGLYGQERNNQMQALAMSPQIGYADADRLAGVGAQREQYLQDQAMEPYQRLQMYQQGIQGNYGGTQTTTQPLYRNRMAGALGGAAAGATLGPWGAAAGGLLGLLGS